MYYIQRVDLGDRSKKTLETVDEFATKKEAQAMRKEYAISDRFGRYYISTRACKAWGER